MSGYRQGHEEGHNPYISYAAQSQNQTEERVFTGHHQNIQQGTTQGVAHGTPQSAQHGAHQNIHPLHAGHLGQHRQHIQQHSHQPPSQLHYSQHPTYAPQQVMAQTPHQESQYGSASIHPVSSMQQGAGSKHHRGEDMGMAVMSGMPQQQIHSAGMGQQPVAEYAPQAYHSHNLPPAKRLRLDDEASQLALGAPSVVGMEGMPEPSARPRGPKLKFTPEDDQKLVELKENKSLTWKQIADFFPGRSSGTLQVRYCTKLKAKTTQWTDETLQKLQVALHEYEQEKWRIIAQKVGTGFTSAACKEKAEELAGGSGVEGEGDGDGEGDADL